MTVFRGRKDLWVGEELLRSADDSGGAVAVVGGRGGGREMTLLFWRRPLLPWLGSDLPAAALPLPSLSLPAALTDALFVVSFFLVMHSSSLSDFVRTSLSNKCFL